MSSLWLDATARINRGERMVLLFPWHQSPDDQPDLERIDEGYAADSVESWYPIDDHHWYFTRDDLGRLFQETTGILGDLSFRKTTELRRWLARALDDGEVRAYHWRQPEVPVSFAAQTETAKAGPEANAWHGLGAYEPEPTSLKPNEGDGGARLNSNKAAVDVIPAYNARTSAGITQAVLKGIDPVRLNPDTRFGRAVYLAERGETAVAEVAHHNGVTTHIIRYNLNAGTAKILDLSDPAVVARWGTPGGENYVATQAIAQRAREAGYNVIKFPSLRGEGNNFAVLDNFDTLLSPQMVVPVSAP